ncbi:MAG: tetratricopeptide repeat protein [Planctomycetota bacterium]
MIRATALILVLLAAPVFAGEEPTAKEMFDAGQASLAKGQFEDAAKAFKAAAKLEPDNKAYTGRAMILVRVLRARKYVETAEVDAKWEKVATSLHEFYVREGLLENAVTLDRKMYEGRPSARTASLLAETLLETGKNAEAEKHLAGLSKDHKYLQNRVYEGIALARTGKKDEAKKLAAGLEIPADTRSGILYDLARLQTLIGETEKNLATLTKCFENLPEKSQAPLREMAKKCPDFQAIAATEPFAKALATKSKVKESDCSGGSGCGSCPSRDSCGSDK